MKSAQAVFTVCTLAFSLQAKEIILQNEFQRLRIEPDNGGRVSSWIFNGTEENLVNTWRHVKKQGKRKPVKPQYSGGILGGHMCGAYEDEQLEAVYTIARQTPDELIMHWKNPFPLFSGLEETRSIALHDRSVRVKLRVENKAKESRVIYYRTMYDSTIRSIDLKRIDFARTTYQAVPLDKVKQQPIVPVDIN